MRIKGRKRHIVTDTVGFLVGLAVHGADVQDRDGAPEVLKSIATTCPLLRHVFADGGYAGPKLKGALEKIGRWTLQIVKRSETAQGFEVIPRRWGIERTLAWLGRCRRMAKDWEKTIASADGVEPVEAPADPNAEQACLTQTDTECRKARIVETLPNGRSYTVYDAGPRIQDTMGPFVVPDGHLFVLGDNRNNSLDSRLAHYDGSPLGYVDLRDVVGRVEGVFVSRDPRRGLFEGWRTERFFKRID